MSTASSGELGRDEGPADDPSGSQSPSPRIVRPVPPPEIRPYSQWLNDCVRAALRRVRFEHGITPYALSVPGLLNKQTIPNIEDGVHSCTLMTLAIVSLRLVTPGRGARHRGNPPPALSRRRLDLLRNRFIGGR